MQPLGRTVWVWDTQELLLKDEKRRSFFDFCKRKNMKEVFFQLQLSHAFDNKGMHVATIEYRDQTRLFLKEANRNGLKIHGLDGHPSYALLENHPKALSIVVSIIEFNKASRPGERFSGVHFDNEPYLLPEFEGSQKDKILEEFLELNKKCSHLVHSKAKNLVYGIDIPFWLAEPNIIKLCDNIGIMDYRNFAGGHDGMIKHGLDALRHGDTFKKKMYIGVETSNDPGQMLSDKETFVGMSEEEFESVLKEAEEVFSKYACFTGFAIHHYKSYRVLCKDE